MSKSCGGGGFKGGDKGGGGSVKVIKNAVPLEQRLDKIPDAFQCPQGHRMKLHHGCKREGDLTCDGPEDVSCCRDGDGILHVGEPRYTCVQCDFDICPSCCEYETSEPLTPEQEKEVARQRLREKTGRAPKGSAEAAKSKAAEEAASKAAEEVARAVKRAEI